MKMSGLIFCVACLASLGLVNASRLYAQELPSAPSAAKQQQQKPVQPPAAAAPQAKEAPGTEADATPPAQAPSATQAAPPEAKQDASGAATPKEAPKAEPANTPSKEAPKQGGGGDDTDNSLTTIRSVVNEVNVVFTVTDKHGHYVKDLKRDDFRVLDDNKPAKEIHSFHKETDLPLQVGLLIDASNSIRDRFKFEQESAIEFLNQIIRINYDKAFVVGFDATPEVTQDFTDNTELLSKGVRALRAGGGTALYDSLYFACRDKLMKAPRTGPVRRAIILLTDGDDNQSRVTREEAIEMAQRAEVVVYTISTNISGVKTQYDKILERIADATGGRAFFPFQLNDVANAFSEIQDELRSQYLLAYVPEDFHPDGRFRAIQIVAAQNPKNLHVRARKGYYAGAVK